MKKFGKALSFLMTVSMLISSCTMLVRAEAGEVQLNASEFIGYKAVDLNFDDVTVPTNLWGFTANGTGFSVASVTDKLNSANKVLQFKGGNTTSSQGYGEFNIPFSDIGKSYQVSFDLYHPLMDSGDTFIRFTDTSKNDVFSLYMRESASSTNILGKTMRYGLNTQLGSSSLSTEAKQGSAKFTTTPQTGTVGANGIIYHVYSLMDFETKKQTLTIQNKATGENIVNIENADITTAQGLSKMFIGYGYNASTYEGVYLDNIVVTVKTSSSIVVEDFKSNKGNVTATIKNLSGVDKNVDAVLATYNEDGTLGSLKVLKATVSGTVGENSYQLVDTVTFNGDSDLVKLFVWEGLTTMKPYTSSMKTIDPRESLNLFSMVQSVPLKNKMVDTGYYVWCGSVVKGDDGKYHMFYSRWEKKYGFVPGWVSHSEIAHAVSDNVDGPYVFSEVSLPARDRTFWDGTTTHNSYIVRHEGKYYLYYMGTTAPSTLDDTTISTTAPTGYSADWYRYRNGQRIGVAVSDSPYGPWTRFDKPILEPTKELVDGQTTFDSMLVTNPAIAIGPDNKVVLLYKGVKDTTGGDMSKSNGEVKFGVSTSDSPTGPFTKSPNLVFTNLDDPTDTRMLGEDPFVWYSTKEGKYKAITRDVTGLFTGSGGGLALFESKDGVNQWKISASPIVLLNRFKWEDGSTSVSNVERPCLVFDDEGNPIMLFGATRLATNESDTTNVFIPLK